MKKNLIVSILFATGLSIFISTCTSIPKGAKAVEPFDKSKYLGKWYEIARFDYRFEKNLDHVTAVYTLKNDGSIRVENTGFDVKKSKWKKSIGKAKSSGSPTEGKLKVSFFGPFYAAYNVIAIDEDYKYALVVGNNKQYLWLLSRDTMMPKNIKDKYVQMAKDLGFDVEKLIWVNQSEK